jgi:diacylglycerol O-acyltransferase / wax synthase
MLRQLSGVDAVFLYMETRNSFGHVSSVSVYENPGAGYQPFETFRSQVEARLPLIEPFRRRLVTVPLELDHPYWANDPDFDLDFHVRSIGLAPPGNEEQLANQVARIISRPLDRTRPLWEAYVIEGLQGGDFAILTKVHHATIDGASGAELLTMLLDPSPDTVFAPLKDTWKPDAIPSQLDMLTRGLASLSRSPQRLLKYQSRMVRQLTRSRGTGFSDMLAMARPFVPTMKSTPREEVRDAPPVLPSRSAPPTPFNRSITPHRRFAYRSTSLSRVRALKAAYGVTVNDIVMTMCAGALRTYLSELNELPNEPLVAMVPVSIRTGKEVNKWTNRVSAIFASLPTHLDDPADRVRFMNEAMLAAKGQFDLIPADTLADFTQFAPPALATRALRMATAARLGDRLNMPVNVVISNVPGPREPLYLPGGALLKHYYPVSTVVEGQGLNITVQSYLDTLDLGLVSCRELVPDLWHLADLCVKQVDVLEDAAPKPVVEPVQRKSTAARTSKTRKTAAPKGTPRKGASAGS